MLQAARSVAAAEGKNIGKALSDLARRGLVTSSQSSSQSGFPVFDVAPDAPVITLDMVKDALE